MAETESRIINPHGERFITSRILELDKTQLRGKGRTFTVEMPDYVKEKAERVTEPTKGRRASEANIRESEMRAVGILDDIMREESFKTIDLQGNGRDFHWVLMWFRTHLSYDSWTRENIDGLMTNPIEENQGIRFVDLRENTPNT